MNKCLKKFIVRVLARFKWKDFAGRHFYNPRWGVPDMHCQSDLEIDLIGKSVLSDYGMMKWFNERYSFSKHLLTLYSIAIGLRPKLIVEVGFGRSSFILAKAARAIGARVITVDMRNFSYLLSSEEKKVMRFVHGKTEDLWKLLDNEEQGVDMFFLDYFSGEKISEEFIIKELKTASSYLKENGCICVHDTIVKSYRISSIFQKNMDLLNCKFEKVSLPYNYGLGILRKIDCSIYGKLNDTWEKK